MRESIRLAAAGAAALLVCGCATVFTGTTDEITVHTDPGDARVYLDGRMVGTGDTTVTISRSGPPPEIRVEKDGYQAQSFKPEAQFNGVALINSTFVLSWGTDILSGAVLHYAQDQYQVQLVEKGSAGLTPDQQVTRFALANWAMLRRDLATGGGEYLDGLGALPASMPARTAFRARLRDRRAALIAADGPRAFATLVERLYDASLPAAGDGAAG